MPRRRRVRPLEIDIVSVVREATNQNGSKLLSFNDVVLCDKDDNYFFKKMH